MKCPILSPIRFVKNTPDYLSIWPNPDTVIPRQTWIEGVFPGQWYKEWLYGKSMVFQFEIENDINTNMSLYKYNEMTEVYDAIQTIPGLNISPVGWVGNSIYKYTVSSLNEGTYYLKFSDNYKSDVFVVTNDATLKKRIIEIKYTNSYNDFGVIFEGQLFTQYLTGQLKVGNPENTISAFVSDRGEVKKLRSTPVRVATLLINEIHSTYIDHVNMIFACDTIQVNGISYQTTEQPSIEEIENSDMVNIVIKLSQTYNDYYYQKL